MKKLLFSAIISGISFCAFAQPPTWDFESWTGTGTGIEPFGWISENAAILPPIYNNPQSVFQATGADVHSGTYAMQIVSVKMTSNPAPTQLPDPVGIAATGAVSFVPPSLKFGFANSSRPASVSFWYKYTPAAGGDVGGCFVALTKWNTTTNKRDTIANGLWTTTAAVTAYTSQSVNLTYYSTTEFPDSMAIIFSSTNLFNLNYTLCLNCGKAGSTLWVDDIAFSGNNAVNEHLSSEGVTLYPNPASEYVNISVDALNEAFSVSVFDVTGKLAATAPLNLSNSIVSRRSGVINTADLATGLYSYTVLDQSGAALRAGKFSVVK